MRGMDNIERFLREMAEEKDVEAEALAAIVGDRPLIHVDALDAPPELELDAVRLAHDRHGHRLVDAILDAGQHGLARRAAFEGAAPLA